MFVSEIVPERPDRFEGQNIPNACSPDPSQESQSFALSTDQRMIQLGDQSSNLSQ